MLELEDIQHFLVTRPAALAARYEFLTFRSAEGGRQWLAGLLDRVGNARDVMSTSDTRWVSVAFTWTGLRALGLDERSLATFPPEFREGMAARASFRPGLPRFMHVYFHDTDLVDKRRLRGLLTALAVIARRRRPIRLDALTAESELDFAGQLQE